MHATSINVICILITETNINNSSVDTYQSENVERPEKRIRKRSSKYYYLFYFLFISSCTLFYNIFY